MQAALERIQAEPRKDELVITDKEPLSPDLVSALQTLATVLEASLPLVQSSLQEAINDSQQQQQNGTFTSNENDDSNNNKEPTVASATWLLNLLQPVPSALEPSQLAQAILDVSRLTTSMDQKQAALFDLLGESEPSMQALMQIAPKLDEIAQRISIASLTSNQQGNGDTNNAVYVDLDEERRQLLRHEAMDTAQMAAIAKAELEALTSSNNNNAFGATHTVVSKQAEKQARKKPPNGPPKP